MHGNDGVEVVRSVKPPQEGLADAVDNDSTDAPAAVKIECFEGPRDGVRVLMLLMFVCHPRSRRW